MVDPDRALLEGVVEIDQTEIPFRQGDAVFARSKSYLPPISALAYVGQSDIRFTHHVGRLNLEQFAAALQDAAVHHHRVDVVRLRRFDNQMHWI